MIRLFTILVLCVAASFPPMPQGYKPHKVNLLSPKHLVSLGRDKQMVRKVSQLVVLPSKPKLLTLGWQCYNGSVTGLSISTNLIDWTEWTNFPAASNCTATIPIDVPFKFARAFVR